MGSPSSHWAASELVDQLRVLAREREAHLLGLERAIASVPSRSLFESLNEVAEELPLVVPVDTVTVRLADLAGKLHLVAATGFSGAEVRAHAMEALDLKLVRVLARTGLSRAQ